MKVLLSIKPEFVKEIFSGNKKYEYRKSIFSRKVKKVIVYSTKPEGLIVGEFTIEKVIEENPNKLWEETKNNSGITKSFFDEYFKDRNKGYALKISNPILYDIPLNPFMEVDNFVAPQSFKYLDDNSNL
ncbi:ASCH domain-containing protein [Phocaeicola paurosaccharolyticus]|uniref:ASCH domain-containing protein n=1 Tax=Phocaeicola paurosaccharolyticus TaxID=732242 RepID=UPI000469F5B8|nr:ASCH domain-containing protein [Phocaeicola paurosaccharolyticus]